MPKSLRRLSAVGKSSRDSDKNPEKIEMKRSMTHDYWGEQRLTVFANINHLKDKVHPYRVNESE